MMGYTPWSIWERRSRKSHDVGTTLHRGMYMPTKQQTLRVAMLAWEIGRVRSGLGARKSYFINTLVF